MIINPHLPAIAKLISETRDEIISVVAPTGSGKSIGIPLVISHMEKQDGSNMRCFISVPNTRNENICLNLQTNYNEEKYEI